MRSRAEIRVDLTGRPRLTRAGGSVVEAEDFPGRQGRLLFAYLATSDRPVPREELADALWPQGPPPNWKRDLSALVSRLRALLAAVGLDGGRALSGAGGCYHLRLPGDAVVDVDRAQRRAEEAVQSLKEGDAERALAARWPPPRLPGGRSYQARKAPGSSPVAHSWSAPW